MRAPIAILLSFAACILTPSSACGHDAELTGVWRIDGRIGPQGRFTGVVTFRAAGPNSYEVDRRIETINGKKVSHHWTGTGRVGAGKLVAPLSRQDVTGRTTATYAFRGGKLRSELRYDSGARGSEVLTRIGGAPGAKPPHSGNSITLPGGRIAVPVGRLEVTYYWMTHEKYYPGPKDTPVRDPRGSVLGRFSRRFVRALRLEGTGKLADGRVLNSAGKGTFKFVAAPYGFGVKNIPLIPYRSVAVDPRRIAIGTTLYIPEAVGNRLPDRTVHDGIFHAHDVGGGIKGARIDLFVGPGYQKDYFTFDRIRNLRFVTVYKVVPAPQGPAKGGAGGGGGGGPHGPGPGAPSVSFIALGDFGTGGRYQHQVAGAMQVWSRANPVDFVIALGDNIYSDGVQSVGDPQFRSKFERPYRNIARRFYMSLGNHDWRGSVQAMIDYTKRSSRWYLPARYYTFTHGPAQFFAIDTQKLGERAQLRWLERELTASRALWKVVFGHHQIYSYGKYGTSRRRRRQLVPLFEKYGVDVYLNGHEHDLQHIRVRGIDFVVSGGGGAGLRDTRRGAGSRFARKAHGFAWIRLQGTRLELKFVDRRGRVLHRHERQKKRP